jgi:hypothetical protein
MPLCMGLSLGGTMPEGNGTPRPTAHGLYVKAPAGVRVRDHRVRRLVRKMRTQMPWLQDSDVPTARAYAEIEILASRAYAILSSVGLTNREGQPLRLLGDFRLLRAVQLQYANALGMSPLSRLQIKVCGDNAAFDLAAAAAEHAESAGVAADDEPR